MCALEAALKGCRSQSRPSHWIVEAIALVYASGGLQCPIGVRAHFTRGMATSWAWSSGISIGEICAAAGWSSPSTFIRFYNLDVPAGVGFIRLMFTPPPPLRWRELCQVEHSRVSLWLRLMEPSLSVPGLSSWSRLSSASGYSTALLDEFPIQSSMTTQRELSFNRKCSSSVVLNSSPRT